MKILKYVFLIQLLSFNSFAVEIPNQFEDGQVTSASQMNENFQALKAELEAQRALIEANLGNQKVVFQGFSAESMDGGQGMLAMQQACHNLVPGSHVCKDTEIALSPYNPNAQNLEGEAWMIRELGPATAGGNYSDGRFSLLSPLSLFSENNDMNAHFSAPNHSCSGWRTVSEPYKGATVNSLLSFNKTGCGVQNKVACCK